MVFLEDFEISRGIKIPNFLVLCAFAGFLGLFYIPFQENYSGQPFSSKSKTANPLSFISRFVKSSKCFVIS